MKTTSFLVHHRTKRNVVVLSECLNINFIQYSEFNSVKLPSQLIVYLFVFTDLYTKLFLANVLYSSKCFCIAVALLFTAMYILQL